MKLWTRALQCLAFTFWIVVVVTSSEPVDEIPFSSAAHQQLLRRRLPGGGDYFDFGSAEAGFAAGVGFAVLALVLLCVCCCCGCSLWDVLAMLCLWEICCDNSSVVDDSFVAF